MNTAGYKADRKLIYEAVKFWQNSRVFRADSVQLEAEQVSTAPWLVDGVNEAASPIVSRWATVTDACEGPDFEDVATEASADDVAELLAFIGDEQSEALQNAVLDLLKENEGSVLYIGKSDSEQAYAIALSEGKFYVASMELEESLLDEGLISMNLLATTVPDPLAPIVPGFAPIEQKLYESLHSAELIAATLAETEEADQLLKLIERFTNDLSTVIVEMMCDAGTFSEKSANLVVETFAGAYAGIVEEAQQFLV